MNARPNLRPVPDFDTGEVVVPEGAPATYGDALQVIERQNAELNGYRLRCSRLERELVGAKGTDPGAPEVRTVLDYFSRRAVETGWWREHPRYNIGDERWTAVGARQKDGRSVADCFVAIEGAFCQDPNRTKRAYVDVTSVFRNNANFERAFEHGLAPDLRRAGRHVRIVPATLVERWPRIESEGDVCMAPGCNHLRLDHDRPRPLEDVFDPPCAVHGCVCGEFCDTVERWMESRERITPCG